MDSEHDELEMVGFFLHSFLRAAVNINALLPGDDVEQLLAADPASWYPASAFTGRMDALAERFTDFEPIQQRIGEEMMRLWFEFGPGRQIVTTSVDFLRFQTGSEGYRSVIRGPDHLVGAFDLVALDESAGTASVRSSTPFVRPMERGVLLGGLQLAGDTVYVDVVQDPADPDLFHIEYH
ncbi:MAG: hypothetical protein EP330_06580 [Deltaproteobacteria bacterium]|nr:MAG: hypothetical protein EP330_06580 [Deltaproteobacteria bacterium]